MTDFWIKGAIITPNQSLLTHMTATVITWSVHIVSIAEQENKSGLGILGSENAVGVGKIFKILTIMSIGSLC